jgi:hypothetical protein
MDREEMANKALERIGLDQRKSAQGSNGRFLGKFSCLWSRSGRLTDKQLEDAW